jgi:hypothetical protein
LLTLASRCGYPDPKINVVAENWECGAIALGVSGCVKAAVMNVTTEISSPVKTGRDDAGSRVNTASQRQTFNQNYRKEDCEMFEGLTSFLVTTLAVTVLAMYVMVCNEPQYEVIVVRKVCGYLW